MGEIFGVIMCIEQRINYQLNNYPRIKKCIKRGYQFFMYLMSKKKKTEGDIVKVSPDDAEHDYFYGYYDKSPWDATGRYMLCMRAKDTWSEPDPKEEADILLFDLSLSPNDNDYYRVLGKTRTWNVQQGCMAQWLGPDFSSRIIYNDLRNGKYCSVIKDVESGEERELPMPVYTVSNDGKTALSLDFSRLHSLRLGYGYSALPDKTKGLALPDETCIWKMNIETGEVIELLKYTDFANFQPRQEMQETGGRIR